MQTVTRGTPGNRVVGCWQGEVLAGISVKALRTQHPTGPATVVRVIDKSEMTDAVGRLVRRLSAGQAVTAPAADRMPDPAALRQLL